MKKECLGIIMLIMNVFTREHVVTLFHVFDTLQSFNK